MSFGVRLAWFGVQCVLVCFILVCAFSFQIKPANHTFYFYCFLVYVAVFCLLFGLFHFVFGNYSCFLFCNTNINR